MSEQATCPVCGYPNDPEADACDNCGAELARLENGELVPPEDTAGTVETAPAPPAAPQKPKHAGQAPRKKPSAQGGTPSRGQLEPELFIRNGILRIQMRVWQALALAGIVFAAIVLIIVYLSDSGAPGSGTVAQQQMPPQQQQQNPNAPTLNEINQARQAVEASPNDPQALLRLSHLLHDAGMFDQAIAMYKRYLQIVPGNPDAQIDMGVCYYSLGELETAERIMKETIEDHPDHQLGHFNLGIVTLAQGDTAEARGWLNRAIELNPENPFSENARNILSRIQSEP